MKCSCLNNGSMILCSKCEDSEKKIEDILDNYKGAWAYASNYQLIEDLIPDVLLPCGGISTFF